MENDQRFIDQFESPIRSGLIRAAELVRKHKEVQLFSHYDADGITSLAIVKTALEREGIKTSYKVFQTLTDPEMKTIKKMPFECMVMTDLGTSYLKEIKDLKRDCVVLDHHQLKSDYTRGSEGSTVFVNPWLEWVDGSKGACGATMAFLFAITLNEDNFDLSQLAVAGMYGDKQNVGGFKEINRMVLKEAVKRKFLSKGIKNPFPLGKIRESMMYTVDPYLPGISGNDTGIRQMLKDVNLDADSEWSEETAEKLSYRIKLELMKQNVPRGDIDDLFSHRYTCKDYLVDVQILSDVLDACGRNGKEDLALRVIETRDIGPARGTYTDYRGRIIDLIKDVEERHTVKMDNIQYFQHSSDSCGGIVADTVMKYFGDVERPVIAFNELPGKYNVSSRCSISLKDKGVNLNLALRKAIEGWDGANAGGHPNAAGGSIPKDLIKQFIENVDKAVGEQKAESNRKVKKLGPAIDENILKQIYR